MNSDAKRAYNKAYFANWYANPINKKKQNARSSQRYYKYKYEPTLLPKELRFWTYVEIGSLDECWYWLGGRTPKGYGRFLTGYAHRFAYESANASIPETLYVCHSCDNPPCVNPAHLWIGTAADNMRDRDRKGRGRYAQLR